MSNLEPDLKFWSEATSPEPVRLYLSHTGIGASSFGSFEGLGWQLIVNKLTKRAVIAEDCPCANNSIHEHQL